MKVTALMSHRIDPVSGNKWWVNEGADPPCPLRPSPPPLRADDGIRTRDPHLGKVMLYQLSHVRVGASG